MILILKMIRTRMTQIMAMRATLPVRAKLVESVVIVRLLCSGSATNGSLYREPLVRAPTSDHLKRIAEKHDISLSQSDLETYQRRIAATCDAYSEVDTLPEPTLPTLYPRTPGYRPKLSENTLNGWSWRTDIQGAKSGKLLGKTVAIKDIIAVAGTPMNMGCAATEGYTPEYDATVVTRILNEGGHILGKTTCGSLCDGGTSFTSVGGPVRNFCDPKHDAGGSSGGSATLVAAGEVDIAVGSDQGGSVRIPASWCGIVGLKPTFGLVPYTGTVYFSPSVDHLGPLARNVHDCALLTEVIAGYDNRLDPRQRSDIIVPEYTKEMKVASLDGFKIGLLKEGFGSRESFDQQVDEIVKYAVRKLTEVGATVEEVSVPLHKKGHIIKSMIGCEEFADTVFRTGGVGRGVEGFYSTSMSSFMLKSLRCGMNDIPHPSKMGFLLSEYLHECYPGVIHNKGQNLRRLLTEDYDEALREYDALAMPTIPFTAPPLPTKGITTEEYLDPIGKIPVNTRVTNATGHPAISVNSGYHDNGLPVGAMFVAKHFDEVTIFKIVSHFESLNPTQNLKQSRDRGSLSACGTT